MPHDNRTTLIAACCVLAGIATWSTDRFQRWANPTTFYTAQVRDIRNNIATSRAYIRRYEGEIEALKDEARGEPLDREFYATLITEVHENISIEREAIEQDRAALAAAEAALSEFRRYPR